MSTHLSSEQISEWVIGEHSHDVERHLHECAACRIEVRGFEETLLSFGNSARQWSDEQLNRNFGFPPNRADSRSSMTGFYWALAVLLLCFFIGHFVPLRAPVETLTKVAATSDADLLKQIDQEVSRTVPGPMQPLTELVSWDANASTTSHSGSQVAQ